jgi:hypothetical protein
MPRFRFQPKFTMLEKTGVNGKDGHTVFKALMSALPFRNTSISWEVRTADLFQRLHASRSLFISCHIHTPVTAILPPALVSKAADVAVACVGGGGGGGGGGAS